MPTPNRQNYIKNRVRREFREGAQVLNVEDVAELVTFASDSLENVIQLRLHLSNVLLFEKGSAEKVKVDEAGKRKPSLPTPRVPSLLDEDEL